MFEVAYQVAILSKGKTFLDPFKIKLLEEILLSGSLSKAALKLNISYQYAWNLINDINQLAPDLIVIKQRGGINGGGTDISSYGKKFIKEYKQIDSKVKKLINEINVDISL